MRAVIAFSIGATLTIAACAQDAVAPSDPTPAPQRSASVVTNYPAPVTVPAPSAQFAPGGLLPTVPGTPPTDIAVGEIGPQPRPGEQIVTGPEGDWTYLVPPESLAPPDTEPIDGE